MDSQSEGVEAVPAFEEFIPLHTNEQKVVAALLVVMRRAMKAGIAAVTATRQVLVSNHPATRDFLDMLPDEGKLPSREWLEGLASFFLGGSGWLGLIEELCATAQC
ncbi:g12800 [Coccomyxa viridis]|uniref:G12800 protein n=1 Tax=Coccomyxa viridis TaxID=1274662 RepID=A0ABP1GDY9_9CHLO